MSTPIPDAIIGSEAEASALLASEGAAGVTRAPETLEDWRELARYNAQIADTLATEVNRLRSEIDRLKGGDSKAPIESKADWTHPLYKLWVELRLDVLENLEEAWAQVRYGNKERGRCPKCDSDEPLTEGPYAPFRQCSDCQLCFIASDRHFALDTIERAQDRGPDA